MIYPFTDAVWITTTGEPQEIRPENGTDFQLEELQKYVGGYIEIISVSLPGWIMVLNEEGKIKGLPTNVLATEISGLYPRDIIVGDVVVCRSDQVK